MNNCKPTFASPYILKAPFHTGLKPSSIHQVSSCKQLFASSSGISLHA